MNRTTALLPLVVALAGAACSRQSADETPATFPMPASVAGVYDGSFPCGNCKEIAASLWVRPDERFMLRQSYVAESGATESNSYSFGRWRWDEASAELVLAGRGPERRLISLDAEHWRLKMPSPVAHVLARDASERPFDDRVLLEGESAVADKSATFVQCVTDLEWPIADAGAYKELRRQHRLLNPRKKFALTTVEARLTLVGEGDERREVLVVEKVVEPIKPGKGC